MESQCNVVDSTMWSFDPNLRGSILRLRQFLMIPGDLLNTPKPLKKSSKSELGRVFQLRFLLLVVIL